ncbi:MAG: hypothetical protein AB7T49_00400 [Oligoflexales bacterium]
MSLTFEEFLKIVATIQGDLRDEMTALKGALQAEMDGIKVSIERLDDRTHRQGALLEETEDKMDRALEILLILSNKTDLIETHGNAISLQRDQIDTLEHTLKRHLADNSVHTAKSKPRSR